MSSPTQVENILSPASPQDTIMAVTPSSSSSGPDQAAVKGGAKPNWSPSGNINLSVFDVLNIFHCRWFLSRANLLANAISAQKAEDGNISWVEFTPQYHSHLVKHAVALVPHPVLTVKKVMFVYILELLNRKGNLAFFDLKVGGRKANNAQKEKRRLAWKWSRASKQERERKAAKVAKLPTRQQQCEACGRKFKSRKTAKKHKCPKSKVVRVPREAARGQASQATLTAKVDKPPVTLTPYAPTAPSNIKSQPAVTGDSQDNSPEGYILIFNSQTDSCRRILWEEWQKYWETGLWRLG